MIPNHINKYEILLHASLIVKSGYYDHATYCVMCDSENLTPFIYPDYLACGVAIRAAESAFPELPIEGAIEQTFYSKELPGVLTMVQNFASTMANFAASGFAICTDDERERRLTICSGCDWFTGEKRCVKCGCFMMAKAGIQVVKCPVGKW